MNTLRMTILSFVLLLIVAAPHAKAQTADEIIAKYCDAMGGKDKLLSIKSVYMEGVAVMANGMEIDTKSWKVKDKLFRQEIAFGTATEALKDAAFQICRERSGVFLSIVLRQRAEAVMLLTLPYPGGYLISMATDYDPPAGFEYQWSGD